MPPRPSGPQHGLSGNPVWAYSLEELADGAAGLPAFEILHGLGELTAAVFTELAMERTRRAAELVAGAIRVARAVQPGAEVTAAPWQAGTCEVRRWAAGNGFQAGTDGTVPGQAVTAYNQARPGPRRGVHVPAVLAARQGKRLRARRPLRKGRTCACNAGARSRQCHRVKQSKGWNVTQPRPGWHQWVTPAGRTYTQGPKRYPD